MKGSHGVSSRVEWILTAGWVKGSDRGSWKDLHGVGERMGWSGWKNCREQKFARITRVAIARVGGGVGRHGAAR